MEREINLIPKILIAMVMTLCFTKSTVVGEPPRRGQGPTQRFSGVPPPFLGMFDLFSIKTLRTTFVYFVLSFRAPKKILNTNNFIPNSWNLEQNLSNMIEKADPLPAPSNLACCLF